MGRVRAVLAFDCPFAVRYRKTRGLNYLAGGAALVSLDTGQKLNGGNDKFSQRGSG